LPAPVRAPPIWIDEARIEPSGWRVPVTVTVWLSCRSDVVPSTCLEIVTVGPNVTFTSQLVLATVIDLPLRSLTVPRARRIVPAAGVAPGEGQTPPRPLPPPVKPLEAPPVPRVPVVDAFALTLFCPTL